MKQMKWDSLKIHYKHINTSLHIWNHSRPTGKPG